MRLKINFRKVLSLIISFVLLITTISYADTVVIGQAPTSNATNKSITALAQTSYLQNQTTGPGTVPSSSTTLSSPLQGVSYDNSVGQTAALIDNNNVANLSPVTKTISSPASNMVAMANSTQTSQIVANSAAYTGNTGSSTSDNGPTTAADITPTANGPSQNTSTSTLVNGVQNDDTSGPGVTNTKSSTNAASIPSYTSVNSGTTNVTSQTGTIVYQVNDNIVATKPSVSAAGALVVNANTKQIYFSKGGFTKFYPAGITTLVTAYILMTYKGLDDNLVVSQTAVTGLESGAKTAGLKAGDTIKVRDALAAMLVSSCCDVANVVAENVAGNVNNFVAIMNKTVKEWGCVGTNFTNPTGLNNDAQVTNTYDAAIMMDKATSNANLNIMLKQSLYVLPATAHRSAMKLTSKNKLFSSYAGVASRMGYTSKAKYTIVSTIEYNGVKLITVALKANGTQYTDSTKLLNYAKTACIEALSKGNQLTKSTNASNVTNVNTTSVATTTTNANTVSTSTSDTAGAWAKDNNGWYFTKSTGQKASNEWIQQNGKLYCVDSSGYMITGWREMSNGNMYYFDTTSGEFRYNTWINTTTGSYYLQADGSLAKAGSGSTKNISTSVGVYTIDENGKAIAKVS